MKNRELSGVTRLLNRLSRLEPRPEAMERALERTRAALVAAAPVPATAGTGNRRARRFLSTAAVAASLLIALAVLEFGWPGRVSPPAFAAVQEALGDLKTVAYTLQVLEADAALGFRPKRVAIELATGRYREEDPVSGQVMIWDVRRRAMLTIFPRQRQAILTENYGDGEQWAGPRDFFRQLRQTPPEGCQRLGDVELDGRQVEQYRLPRDPAVLGSVELVVFVTADDHLPIRIEGSFDLPDTTPRTTRFVWKDFLYNQADASLWSLTAPAGYRLEKIDGSPRQQGSSEHSAPIDLGPPSAAVEVES